MYKKVLDKNTDSRLKKKKTALIITKFPNIWTSRKVNQSAVSP